MVHVLTEASQFTNRSRGVPTYVVKTKSWSCQSSASFSRSSSWRSRWSLRAFTAPAVSFTLRRLLFLFGGPSLRPPLDE
jgi:hypothetical protein